MIDQTADLVAKLVLLLADQTTLPPTARPIAPDI